MSGIDSVKSDVNGVHENIDTAIDGYDVSDYLTSSEAGKYLSKVPGFQDLINALQSAIDTIKGFIDKIFGFINKILDMIGEFLDDIEAFFSEILGMLNGTLSPFGISIGYKDSILSSLSQDCMQINKSTPNETVLVSLIIAGIINIGNCNHKNDLFNEIYTAFLNTGKIGDLKNELGSLELFLDNIKDPSGLSQDLLEIGNLTTAIEDIFKGIPEISEYYDKFEELKELYMSALDAEADFFSIEKPSAYNIPISGIDDIKILLDNRDLSIDNTDASDSTVVDSVDIQSYDIARLHSDMSKIEDEMIVTVKVIKTFIDDRLANPTTDEDDLAVALNNTLTDKKQEASVSERQVPKAAKETMEKIKVVKADIREETIKINEMFAIVASIYLKTLSFQSLEPNELPLLILNVMRTTPGKMAMNQVDDLLETVFHAINKVTVKRLPRYGKGGFRVSPTTVNNELEIYYIQNGSNIVPRDYIFMDQSLRNLEQDYKATIPLLFKEKEYNKEYVHNLKHTLRNSIPFEWYVPGAVISGSNRGIMPYDEITTQIVNTQNYIDLDGILTRMEANYYYEFFDIIKRFLLVLDGKPNIYLFNYPIMKLLYRRYIQRQALEDVSTIQAMAIV